MEALTISPTKAAELLGVSRPTIYKIMQQSGFPAFHVGGRVLISTEGLREWVRDKSTEGVGA